MGVWFHFAQRLRERYGIDVSFEYYLVLIREKIETIRHLSNHKTMGWLKVQQQEVLVVKERNRNRLLITALAKNSYQIEFLK